GELRLALRVARERILERARPHRPERHAVRGDAVRAHLGREPTHEPHRARLRRAVDRLEPFAAPSGIGDDRDDPPPSLLDHRADADERRADLGSHAVASTRHQRTATREVDVDAHGQTSMTTGMTAGRRRVRSSMKRANDFRQWRRIVSKSVAPSPAACAIDSRTTSLASSIRSSASGAYTQPRVTISGPVTISPVVASTVTITTTTPSSDSI